MRYTGARYLSAHAVAMAWDSMAFMATAFKNVDFPEAFEPVIKTLVFSSLGTPMELGTGSFIRGCTSPSAISSFFAVLSNSGELHTGIASLKDAAQMIISR